MNEVRRDGTVIHLTSFKIGEPKNSKPTGAISWQEKNKENDSSVFRKKDKEPEAEPKKITDADTVTLRSVLGNDVTDSLTQAYHEIQTKKLGSGFKLSLGTFDDKEKRTELHKV